MSDNSFPSSPKDQQPVAPPTAYPAPAAAPVPPAPPVASAPPAPPTPSYPGAAAGYQTQAPAYGAPQPTGYAAPGYADPGYAAPGYAAPSGSQIAQQQPAGAYPAYGTPSYPVYAAPRPNSGLAITSLICGIAGFVLSWLVIPALASIAAVITGHMALKQTKANPALGGRGMAFAGLILGYAGIAVLLLVVVVPILMFLFFGAMTLPFIFSS